MCVRKVTPERAGCRIRIKGNRAAVKTRWRGLSGVVVVRADEGGVIDW